MAAFFPYLLMDGMNEKGLAMSVLKLRGDPTLQDTGKNKISTTVALRLVLDRAATVDEALALLDEYDMQSSMPEANFHFLLADASGKAVVLEYLPNGQRMEYDQNYVTNFYLTENVPYAPVRGKDRYDLIEQTLIFKKGVMSEAEVMALLAVIGQPETEEATSMTQWSVVYNLTDLTGRVAVVREYDNVFRFSLDGMIQPYPPIFNAKESLHDGRSQKNEEKSVDVPPRHRRPGYDLYSVYQLYPDLHSVHPQPDGGAAVGHYGHYGGRSGVRCAE